MAKTGNSEKTTVSKGERTAKDHAKAVGNGLLGVGEALLGVGIMLGTVALVGVSGGSALLMGSGVADLFAAGFSLTADGASRASSPYGDKPKQVQPVSQMDEEERRKLEQAKALARSQTREQTTAIEQGEYSGKSNSAPGKQTQMSLPIAVKGSQVVQLPRSKESEEMSSPRGMGAELLHKIRKNPWKTLGTALLATAFPVGTAIAGAVAVGVVAKSGYDAYVNKKAAATINPSGYSSNSLQPVSHKKLYEPKISPPSTPTRNQTYSKSKTPGI